METPFVETLLVLADHRNRKSQESRDFSAALRLRRCSVGFYLRGDPNSWWGACCCCLELLLIDSWQASDPCRAGMADANGERAASS